MAAPSPLVLLLPVSLAELAINRVAVPMLRPLRGEVPAWHTALDFLGLFLFYFASLLAVLVVGLRVVRALERRGHARTGAVLVALPLAILGAGAAWAVLVGPSKEVTLVLEVALAVAVLVAMARGLGSFFGRPRDAGVAVAVAFFAGPMLVHSVAVLGTQWIWGADAFESSTLAGRATALALVVAGLISPYCLAPRPFVRAVTRLWPVVVAISVALLGAWLLRSDYFTSARALRLALGLQLDTTRADPQLTMFLLSAATVVWTITSCALAPRAQRQAVALALGLLVAGGVAYQWPLHYLLLALGLTLLADLAAPVRLAEATLAPARGAAELAIDDTTWGRYLAAVSTALRKRCSSVHALTSRGSDGSTSTVLIGDAGGLALRARIDRDGGAVIGVDLAVGGHLEEVPERATLTVVSESPGLAADAPLAGDELPRGADAFGRRFRCHGDGAALGRLFDAGERERAAGLLDGWLALVAGRNLRFRCYPGRSSAVESFLPLEDLAQGRVPAGAGERMLVVVELLLELAARAELVISSAETPSASAAFSIEAAASETEVASASSPPRAEEIS